MCFNLIVEYNGVVVYIIFENIMNLRLMLFEIIDYVLGFFNG